MTYKSIQIKNCREIGIICLNNPDSLNIIEPHTFEEINSALNLFKIDNKIKVILLKAVCGLSKKGKKIFSAGINLKEYDKKFELADKNPSEFKNIIRKNRELLTEIEEFKKPVIIAADGTVIGGFFELSLSCDLILASKQASFKLNEVNVGLIPGYGGISRLLKIVGKNKTFEIISTGREISSAEALSMGIIAEIFDDEDFEEKILAYCENIAKKSSTALCLIKNTINNIYKAIEIEEMEIDNFLKAVQSEDSKKEIGAFLCR